MVNECSLKSWRQFPALFMLLVTSIFTGIVSADQKQNNLPPPKHPNIVIILADDMGYGDAGCYGNRRYETPHLDRLARAGIRFTDFHASGSVCSPTRAGLLTGRYQQRSGLDGVIFADPKQNRHHGLHPNEVTFPELLQSAGYRTALFGKWHLGYETQFNPLQHGFERFRGYVSGNVDYFSHCDRMGIADWWNGRQLEPETGYVTHLLTQHAVRFIEENAAHPFCLYIAHEAVHSPYQGPRDKPVRSVGPPDRRSVPAAAGRKDIPNAYAEMMHEMDVSIGSVVEILTQQGLAEKTFIFFFSDNGANRHGSNGSLRGHKGSLWEGGHRVPAIAAWPGRIKARTETSATTISLDLMPTLLELAGVSPPKDHTLDGTSLLPILRGEQQDKQRTLFWSFRDKSAARKGPWKLVTGELPRRRKHWLFNLATDPGEQHDLSDQHPKRVAQMKQALATWKTDVTTDAPPERRSVPAAAGNGGR